MKLVNNSKSYWQRYAFRALQIIVFCYYMLVRRTIGWFIIARHPPLAVLFIELFEKSNMAT